MTDVRLSRFGVEVLAFTDPDVRLSRFAVEVLAAEAALPTTPTNPAATATGADAITVTWDDVGDETGYRVERSPDGSTGWTDVSGTLPADTTSYGDTGLTADTEYFYRVSSVNAVGSSAPSSTVSATTDAGGDIFACLSAYDCLTADPFDCCCL